MPEIFPAVLIPVLSAFILLFSVSITRFLLLRFNGAQFALILISVGMFLLAVSSPLRELALIVVGIDWCPPFSWIVSLLGGFEGGIHDTVKKVSPDNNLELNALSAFCLFWCVLLSIALYIIDLIDATGLRRMSDNFFSDSFAGKIGKEINDLWCDERPALITLKSKKVYVGYIIEIPSWHNDVRAISLLPSYSGYRDDEHDLILTNDYEGVFKTFKEVLLPTEENKGCMGLNLSSPHPEVPDFNISIREINRIVKYARVTFSIDEIETISPWIPFLYDFQKAPSFDDSK